MAKKEKNSKKLTKVFNINSQKKVAMSVFYVGIDYNGFEKQGNCTNTIESHLFSALSKTMLIKDIQSSY